MKEDFFHFFFFILLFRNEWWWWFQNYVGAYAMWKSVLNANALKWFTYFACVSFYLLVLVSFHIYNEGIKHLKGVLGFVVLPIFSNKIALNFSLFCTGRLCFSGDCVLFPSLFTPLTNKLFFGCCQFMLFSFSLIWRQMKITCSIVAIQNVCELSAKWNQIPRTVNFNWINEISECVFSLILAVVGSSLFSVDVFFSSFCMWILFLLRVCVCVWVRRAGILHLHTNSIAKNMTMFIHDPPSVVLQCLQAHSTVIIRTPKKKIQRKWMQKKTNCDSNNSHRKKSPESKLIVYFVVVVRQ